MNIVDFKLPLNGGNSTTGEKHIENVLQIVSNKLNFFYNREVRIGKFDGKFRRADFCFNYNGRTFLIEFDGIQHSVPVEAFGGKEKLIQIKRRDRWENLQFCPEHNICLIRYKVFSNSSNQQDQINAQKKLLSFITPERLELDIKKAFNCKYVQNSVSYGRPRLRIALDIDDTVVDWRKQHEKKFKCKLDKLKDVQITRQVLKCQHDRDFWTNLPLLEKPNFIPVLYCTKRINSKQYTKNCFSKLGLPQSPIYQVINQYSNKVNYIKGRCDIIIDDSWRNVEQCIKSGLPALLITRSHNKDIKTPYRVNKLNYQEITDKYYQLKLEGKWS